MQANPEEDKMKRDHETAKEDILQVSKFVGNYLN
jgi:hypothetical protein